MQQRKANPPDGPKHRRQGVGEGIPAAGDPGEQQHPPEYDSDRTRDEPRPLWCLWCSEQSPSQGDGLLEVLDGHDREKGEGGGDCKSATGEVIAGG